MEDINTYAQRVEGDYYNRALERIQPSQQQEIIDLQTRLINAGIPEGSVAHDNALAELRMSHQDTLRDLASESIREGQALADAQLGRATGLRSYQLGEGQGLVGEQERIRDRQLSDYLLSRSQPLSEIATLSGQAAPPPAIATTGLNVPAVSVAPPPIFGAAQAQGLDANRRYSTATDAYGAQMAAIGSAVAGAGSGGAFNSDITLKKNIKYKSKSKSGLNVYEFEYNWSPQKYTGVMAQEVKKLKPSAVSENIFGHMMVDYSQLDVNMERV